jgi:murein DD-endopeptidase MepM/ murein hydrolase activator NlpD
MYRLRSDLRNGTTKRRTTVLLSAAVLFLVVLLATGAQAGFGLNWLQTEPNLEPDGICPTPTPSESPSPIETELSDVTDELEDPDCVEEPDPTETDDDDDDDGKGGKDDDGKGGKDDDGKKDGGDHDGKNDGRKDDGSKSGDGGGDDDKKKSDDSKKSDDDKGKKGGDEVDLTSGDPAPFKGKYNATGDFDTDRLQFLAGQLRARDVSEDEILEAIYPPFIIGGPAAWTDTWGAPRYGPGPIVRTHEGQDVFCKYGDPVLATEPGEVEFDEGGLGGLVARLHRKDGSYWYYAHLSDWNTKEFKSGDKVETGDVIGYCGNTGNAITTPPHVHFGLYQKNGSSENPMGYLVGWLKKAEARAEDAFEKITGEDVSSLDELMSSRLFGDAFSPDISELKISAESLLASGSSPETGALGLAETALRAALSDGDDPGDLNLDDLPLEAGGTGEGSSPLEELLEDDPVASD